MSSNIKITLVKSVISVPKKHRDVVAGLGLKRVNQTVERIDTPEIRGMVSKVSHLLSVA